MRTIINWVASHCQRFAWWEVHPVVGTQETTTCNTKQQQQQQLPWFSQHQLLQPSVMAPTLYTTTGQKATVWSVLYCAVMQSTGKGGFVVRPRGAMLWTCRYNQA